MKEYIERKAIYKSACTGCTRHGEEIGSCFSNEPCEKLNFAFTTAPAADVVEVVRCKDCKHIRPEVDAHTHEAVGCWCSLLDLGSIEDEHFCSFGERRNPNDHP